LEKCNSMAVQHFIYPAPVASPTETENGISKGKHRIEPKAIPVCQPNKCISEETSTDSTATAAAGKFRCSLEGTELRGKAWRWSCRRRHLAPNRRHARRARKSSRKTWRLCSSESSASCIIKTLKAVLIFIVKRIHFFFPLILQTIFNVCHSSVTA